MKQARPDSIGSIFAKKESAFEGAKALLTKTGHHASIKRGAELFYATAIAQESGLDPSSLNEVLITGKGNTSQQLSAVSAIRAEPQSADSGDTIITDISRSTP